MPKLNNRYQLPSIPIFWTHKLGEKTHRIEWRPTQATFYDWVRAVWAWVMPALPRARRLLKKLPIA